MTLACVVNYDRRLSYADGLFLWDLPLDHVTFIVYGPYTVQNGSVIFPDTYADLLRYYVSKGDDFASKDTDIMRGNLNQLYQLKTRYKHLKSLARIITTQSEDATVLAPFLEQHAFDGAMIDGPTGESDVLDLLERRFAVFLRDVRVPGCWCIQGSNVVAPNGNVVAAYIETLDINVLPQLLTFSTLLEPNRLHFASSFKNVLAPPVPVPVPHQLVRRSTKDAGTQTDPPDAAGAAVRSLLPWSAGVVYRRFDRARFRGRSYECRETHQAKELWSPDAAVTLWFEV